MIVIDGSQGEGGGQLLRTALSLSLSLNIPFRMENIRANRKIPGLRPQHLAVVNAAAALSSAQVEGAALGSRHLAFRPGPVRPGSHHFDIGTAGSAILLVQTLLLPLALANRPSRVSVIGGTHNPLAPSFDFLVQTYLPLLARMGIHGSARLLRHGFYPAGGGQVEVEISPAQQLEPLLLEERGELLRCEACALLARLHQGIGERELRTGARLLGLAPAQLVLERVASVGPGNAFLVTTVCERITETFTAIGTRGVPAEAVATSAAQEALRYLEARVPVGVHLADQLLLPMALARGGAFVTLEPSLHATTNIHVIEAFTQARFSVERLTPKALRIAVR